MAEALLIRLFEEAEIPAEVRSAGTLPWIDGPAHPDAVRTVAGSRLDLSGHAAQSLTEELVGWADVVLGMQKAHVLQVRDIDSAADVRLITDFDPEGPRRDGIEDPIGKGPEVYVRVFGEIRRCLEGFVASRSHSTRTGQV
jgi:protein-tyrosine-phosphatase